MPPQVDRATLDRIKARRAGGRVGGRGGGPGTPAPTRALPAVRRTDPATSKVGGYGGTLIRGVAGLVPGGPWGAVAGGGGELLAQMLERFTGARDDFNLTQVGAQTGIGAVPFGKYLGGAKSMFAAGAKGATFGGAASAITDLAETGEIDPEHLKRGVLIGAGGGALGRGLVNRFGTRGSSTGTPGEVIFNDQTVPPRTIRPSRNPPVAPARPQSTGNQGYRRPYPGVAPTISRDALDELRQRIASHKRAGEATSAQNVRERLEARREARTGQPLQPRGTRPEPPAQSPGDRLVEGLEPLAPRETSIPQGGHFEDTAKLDLSGVDPRLIGPTGKLKIPAELVAVYNRLKPRWNADRVAQEASDTGVDVPSEDLLQLALRHARRMDTRKPRDFMGEERKAHAQLYDRLEALKRPSAPKVNPLARLQIGRGAHGNVSVEFPDQAHADLYALLGRQRRHITEQGTRGVNLGRPMPVSRESSEGIAKALGVDVKDIPRLAREYRDRITNAVKREKLGDATEYRAPKWSDESGFINPDLAFTLGGAATGAVAAPLLDEDPSLGTVAAGAGLGALGGTALRRPDLLERLRYFSLLSSPLTHAKNVAGNASAVLSRATEDAMTGNAARAGSTVREFFKPKTLDDLVHYFRNPSRQNTRWGSTQGVLGVPSRLMGAMDDASKAALGRAGTSADDAELITFTGQPRSKSGAALVEMQENAPLARFVMPFVRTATNIAERGLERTPGIGFLPAVRKMDDRGLGTASARQALGALAVILGAKYGADHPLALPALGPFALPGAVGAAASEAMEGGKSNSDIAKAGFRAAVKSTPVPSESYQYDPARILAQFVPNAVRDLSPVAPSEFDTSQSLLAPAMAKIPIVNQSLPRKRRRASRARTRRQGSGSSR